MWTADDAFVSLLKTKSRAILAAKAVSHTTEPVLYVFIYVFLHIHTVITSCRKVIAAIF